MPQNTHTDLELFARCAAGFEGTLSRELKGLAVRRVRPLKGGAAFFGSLADAYRVCLWSRIATRVQLVLARLDARDADALYAGVTRMPWETHIASGTTISVQAHGENARLRNTQFTALKVKDAVCDRLRAARGGRPDVDPHDPDLAIDISVRENHATIYLNLSGPSLHRREYRAQSVQTEAPLKETLAAGVLLAAGWDRLAREGTAFADPMCGSGTLAIEAALIKADIAPGSLRTRWGFTGWAQHDDALWSEIAGEARHRADSPCEQGILFVAGDIDTRAISIARANAERAGVAHMIDFYVAGAEHLGSRLEAACGSLPERGLIAVNPPYGHRLQTSGRLSGTYAALAQGIASLPEAWRMAAITPDAGIDTALGRRASRTIPCFNGPIRTAVRIYDTMPSQRTEVEVVSLSGVRHAVFAAEKNSGQFAARLRKVAKERAKWARKTDVTCYRIYDADLPEYALSIDLFTACYPDGERFIRVEERPAPASIDADQADIRFSDACALIPAVLDIDRANMHVQGRPRRDGGGRQRPGQDPLVIHIEERGHVLEANLSARRDTGLPLDQRAVRELIGSKSRGVRFLSLGSYAGAPAVYAAVGGAAEITMVDPAQSYLDWARRAMEENGFSGRRYRFERSELAAWLRSARRSGRAFDLVYCDASAIAGCVLPEQIAGMLASDGTLILMAGPRTFEIDGRALEAAGFSLEDMTARTIPPDFERTPKIHRCWLVTRRSH
ncbi:bifunctional 23S rRNA (guanine(2069)-N(7))-methyltransferase RlmK/23S rRNA (guanine(2445)-N(2))-methyltransferase RlmL [Coriobacteriales bacterium OH1046]|nr:bifunctional 23S rRNA (guanine(2069)-N(7))-methyltransferase RlmK/23S rRNA (guanine(2445)-N(2))-methyltransferase RlmL [Coriobacteriales bacterium OH1046]